MRHGHFNSGSGAPIDEVLAVFMPREKSYTGLDQIEIFCHGGDQVVRLILDEIVKSGARLAQPGEFTKTAFLNGRIDLAEAEAVAEMIAASTELSYAAGRDHLIGSYSKYVDELRARLITVLADVEASIDFTEEEIEAQSDQELAKLLDSIHDQISELAATYRGGRIIKEGFRVVICGRPNAGKSSLFNLLLEQERALVDPEAGTTRDYLSEWIDLDGFAVNIIDTAGMRVGAGRVEAEGQKRSEEMIARADLIVWMVDLTEPDCSEVVESDIREFGESRMLLVGNKIDETAANAMDSRSDLLPISCVSRAGIDKLRKAILDRINEGIADMSAGQVVTSARHRGCLDRAAGTISKAISASQAGESPEIVAFELRLTVDALGEITGKVYNEEILGEIFSRFCIGK